MRKSISLFAFGVLLSNIFLFSLVQAAPGTDYSIIGTDDFTSPQPGESFNATEFDLLSQVTDMDNGKFYWKTQTGTGVGGSAGDIITRSDIANIGIGMTTAPSAKLHIRGDGTGTDKALRIQNSNPDDVMVVQDDGKVGIGTASPDYLLNLGGSTQPMKIGMDNGTGSNNIQVMYLPDQSSTEAAGSLFVGTGGNGLITESDGEDAQSGWSNTVVGINAGAAITFGQDNTALGNGAIANITTGDGNTVIGDAVMYNNVDGSDNTVIGTNAAWNMTSGDSNVIIGATSGSGLTTGSRNILIGDNITPPQGGTQDDQLSIGNVIFGTGGLGSGTAVGEGWIGIGTPNPEGRLDVRGEQEDLAQYSFGNPLPIGTGPYEYELVGTNTGGTTITAASGVNFEKIFKAGSPIIVEEDALSWDLFTVASVDSATQLTLTTTPTNGGFAYMPQDIFHSKTSNGTDAVRILGSGMIEMTWPPTENQSVVGAGNIETQLTGTAKLEPDNITVTGTGTEFVDELTTGSPGSIFKFDDGSGNTFIGIVESINSDTELTLQAPGYVDGTEFDTNVDIFTETEEIFTAESSQGTLGLTVNGNGDTVVHGRLRIGHNTNTGTLDLNSDDYAPQALFMPLSDFPGNIAVGDGLQNMDNTTADDPINNTVVGIKSAEYLTTGIGNASLGYEALQGNTGSGNEIAGDYNTAVGYQALQSANGLDGDNNTAIGKEAGKLISGGDENTAIGYQSLDSLTTGSDNVSIGSQTGSGITDGDKNIVIGYNVTPDELILNASGTAISTNTEQLNIGGLIFAEGGFGTGSSVGTGRVGIAEAQPFFNETAPYNDVRLDIGGQLRIQDVPSDSLALLTLGENNIVTQSAKPTVCTETTPTTVTVSIPVPNLRMGALDTSGCEATGPCNINGLIEGTPPITDVTQDICFDVVSNVSLIWPGDDPCPTSPKCP
jgi:hypothetical protein